MAEHNTGRLPELREFLREQRREWPLLGENTRRCEQAEVREVTAGGRRWEVQLNEARAVSTGADVSAAAIAARPCFLCAKNRPREQRQINDWWEGYSVLANPYPVVPGHLVIASTNHEPQEFTPQRAADMWRMAQEMPGYAVIFNGPRSGASAPDHFHFQAVEATRLPLTKWVEGDESPLPFRALTYECATADEASAIGLENIGEDFNAIAWRKRRYPSDAGEYEENVTFVLIPRRAHRPDFYGRGEGQMLISPGTIDLAGHIVLPRREDFERIDADVILRTLNQTCFTPATIEP